MEGNKQISKKLSGYELEKVSGILQSYSIDCRSIEKINGVYRINCDGKSYRLERKEEDSAVYELKRGLINYLTLNGLDNIVHFAKTKDDKEYVKGKRGKYFMTQWMDGRQCDLNNINDVLGCTSFLANFHTKSKGFYSKDIKIKSTRSRLKKLMKRREDMVLFNNIILGKKIKSHFDMIYYESLYKFQRLMDISLDLLEKAFYSSPAVDVMSNKVLCHRDSIEKNLTADSDGKLYIHRLGDYFYDLKLYDLAKFIRRVLNKNTYRWNFEIAEQIIDSYNKVNILKDYEYAILLAFIIFPYKFWKLGNRKYVKKVKLAEEVYVTKLQNTVDNAEKQFAFIDKYINNYSVNIIKKE